jgi:hypothetical protein
VRIVERIPGHYEIQGVQDFGRVYRWCPEQVVLECEACGARRTSKRSELISSLITCECGARCSARVREELLIDTSPEEEDLHPWRTWHSSANAGIPV